MTNLVYWYGQYDELSAAYSFLKTKDLESVDLGRQKAEKKQQQIRKKQEQGKKLIKNEKLLLKAMEEMQEDIEKDPLKRNGYRETFLEDHEFSDGALPPGLDDDSKPDDIREERKQPAIDEEKKMGKKREAKGVYKKRKTVEKAVDTGESTEDKFDAPKSTTKKATNESSKSRKTKKKRPKKADSTNDSPESSGPSFKKPKTADVSVDTQHPTENGVVKSATPAASTATALVKEELIDHDELLLMEEVSSHDEADDDYEGDGGGGAEEDDDIVPRDYEAENRTVGIKKKRKKDGKDASKKISSTTAKKNQRQPKGSSADRQNREEQNKFEECERKYLDLLKRWEIAIANKDVDQLSSIYDKLLKNISKFTAPFMEAYRLSALMKDSKAILNNEKRKSVMAAFKGEYTSLKKKVPPNFQPVKKSDRDQQKSAMALEREHPLPDDVETHAQPTAMTEEKRREKYDNVTVLQNGLGSVPNAKDRSSRHTETLASLTDNAPSSSDDASRRKSAGSLKLNVGGKTNGKIPEKRKKFSLGTLMKPDSSSQLDASASNPIEEIQRTASTGSLSHQNVGHKAPTWIAGTGAFATSIKSSAEVDEKRELALEFLRQAAPFVPPGKNVDYEAIARALETATFEWAVTLDAESNAASTTNGEWLEPYWDKVHSLTAALSGKGEKEGTLGRMIARGDFGTVQEVVNLSDDQLWKSYQGNPMER